jgi:serine/threonine protein kinase
VVLRRRDRGSDAITAFPVGYTDLEEIGGGAFATVYRATEVDTGRKVALKIVKVDNLHPHLLEAFHQEILALGKVSDHPNIVTLYRPLSTPDGRPVLVLELCKESLSQQVRVSGPLDARTVIRVGIKIAGALETAHLNGFLHRDMKPQNILVTQFGEPALADFGVAALEASTQASAGVFGFTTLHAAPEMLEGHALSPATDVYGLASTIYQLLTGLAPFAPFENEAPASVILRIIRDPARPLRSEGVPVELSDLLEASLAKNPDDRPATAVGFADALQAIEAAQGWAMTDYVVWGSTLAAEGEPGAGPPPETRDPGKSRATVPAPAASPSVPPPLNPAPPAATVEPTVRPAPPRVVERAPSGPPGTPGPSIAAPEVVARNVVVPDKASRGQPEVPIDSPAAPLEPMPDPDANRPTDRPVFVDPGPHEYRMGSPLETVYEETLQGGQLFASARPESAELTSPSPWWREVPAYVLVGFAAAVVVVVLAILLILGTL